MNLKEYFAEVESPSANSPVGKLMEKLIEKNPGMGFEEARLEANRLLDKAAGRKKYTLPKIYSPAEMEANKVRLRKLSE